MKLFDSRWANPKYIYEIELNKNNNILKISNLKQLLKFHKKFAELKENNYKINWSNVKKEYDLIYMISLKDGKLVRQWEI